MITRTEQNDKTLAKAPKSYPSRKSYPSVADTMNVCEFTQYELSELDQVIKIDSRKNNMLGQQASNERLYMEEKMWKKT